MIVNISRSNSKNRGQLFFVCTNNGFRSDILFFIVRCICSRLLAVGASLGLMDNFSLFLPVAGSLVSFVFVSGDGNDCIDVLVGPLILLVEVSIISKLAFADAFVKELEGDEGSLGLESLWV